MIAQWQIDQFHQQGFLVVEEVLSSADIAALQSDFDGWVEESRGHATVWGETLDGRPRFDIERDHAPDHPSLRRVASPTEISEAYRHTALNSRMATIAAQHKVGMLEHAWKYPHQLSGGQQQRVAIARALIGGSGTRFHHSKINSKLPHTATEVKWHQDFLFTPHSNDDIITALLMVSEVTPENGPLNVVPGSHQGPLWSHWQEGRFTGAVDDEVVATHCQQPQACFGPAGSVCFMHTRLLHASSPNETALPRTLFISVYAAEDALPYGENPLPSRHAGQLVAGEESGLVRSTNNQLRLPQKPRGASFFVQQAGADRASM
ncbi:phytanoyl-CoA hydroxylase [Klebsiella sp. SORGH_AS 826]|nr:phytanoyl-CoA dioxygenase family protein [Klebsiella sp. SORGH_AS_0826]MDR6258725.1 phytanoyl-CoA hydroxylase [Klebsiella sp. SORGH_AS_0826]